MTSAASHLLQLNGSNLRVFTLLIAAIVLLSACKTQRKQVEPPTRPDDPYLEERMPVITDTIQWSDVTGLEFEPVGYPEDSPYRERIPRELPAPLLKDQYVITLALSMEEWPQLDIWEQFIEEDMEEEEREEILELKPVLNERALSFLNGFELAFRQELGDQTKFVIEVVAIGEKSSESEIAQAFSKLKHKPDIIIGGENRDELESIARIAAEKRAVLFNPWFPGRFNIAPGAQVVSVQPSLSAHFEVVLKYLHKLGPKDRFYVIHSPREESRVEEFRKLFQNEFPDLVFGEIFFRDDIEILNFNFEEFFDDEFNTIFFLPMTRNHPFIYPILRTLDLRSGNNNFEVLGLTLWDRDVHIELHSKMNIINTSVIAPVYGDTVLNVFNPRFYEEMGYIGSSDEYEGYRMGEFMRRSLLIYGRDFPLYLPYSSLNSNYFRFKFSDFNQLELPVESFGKIESNLQNKGLFMLKFDNGKFNIIDR